MDMVKLPKRFDIVLVNLDPTVGGEIQKTRPAMIVSPEEINRHLKTVIIAPMTTTLRSFPTRIPLTFQGKKGEIALDQIRTIDKSRITKTLGRGTKKTCDSTIQILQEMFSL